jgi:hypothetical protein
MRICLAIFSLMLITACGTDDPKPPEAFGISEESMSDLGKAVEASAVVTQSNVTVRHQVKGKDVYVEVIIPGFTFSSPDQKKNIKGHGYVKLYLNGKQIDKIHQAAFIVKGLPTGKHNLKIELVNNDSSSYGVEEELPITIP